MAAAGVLAEGLHSCGALRRVGAACRVRAQAGGSPRGLAVSTRGSRGAAPRPLPSRRPSPFTKSPLAGRWPARGAAPPWLFFFFMNGGGDVSAPRPFPRAPAIHAAGAARRGGAGRGGSKGTEAPGGRGDRDGDGDRGTATTMVATEGLREMEGSALRRLVGRDEASPGPGGGGPGGSSGGPGGSSGGPGRCLVLDCRPFLAHSAGHIRGALNVRCNTIVRRRAKGAVSLEQILPAEGEVRARLRAGLYAAVVVYDERSPRAEALRDDSTVALVVRALRRDSARADIRLLAGTGGRGEKRGVPPLSPPQLLSLLTPACPRGEPPLPEVPGPRGWRPEGAAGGWEAPGERRGGSRAERAPRRCPGPGGEGQNPWARGAASGRGRIAPSLCEFIPGLVVQRRDCAYTHKKPPKIITLLACQCPPAVGRPLVSPLCSFHYYSSNGGFSPLFLNALSISMC